MRVCKTCDAAMEAFRKALLLGQAEEAMSAYSTGCVNLDRPYTIYHGEVCVEREADFATVFAMGGLEHRRFALHARFRA